MLPPRATLRICKCHVTRFGPIARMYLTYNNQSNNRVKYLFCQKMQYLRLKFPFREEEKNVEIQSEICKSVSELGYIKNLQKCL